MKGLFKLLQFVIDMYVTHSDFWAAKGGPYIVFTFTGSVRNVRNDVNIYIYIYIYIYMSTTWRSFRRESKSLILFSEFCVFASVFVNEESLRPKDLD